VHSDPEAVFSEQWLRPVDDRVIVARILGNLERSLRLVGDATAALTAAHLQARIPGVLAAAAQRQIADRLAEGGRFDWAAGIYEALAAQRPDAADTLHARAVQLRARLN